MYFILYHNVHAWNHSLGHFKCHITLWWWGVGVGVNVGGVHTDQLRLALQSPILLALRGGGEWVSNLQKKALRKGSSIIVIIFTSVHSVRWGEGGQGRSYAGLDWEPLVNRRRAFRMFMFYKMHSGVVAIHPTLYLTPRQYHTSHKYYIPHSRIDQQDFSFFPSTVRLWNKLPATTAHAPSLNVFKARVALL